MADSTEAAGKRGFFAELKRRNVLRAAALYIAAVWALAQGISQLSGPLGLASRITVWFLIACAIGFPFWIAFAWFYEWTPHGIKRESEDAPSDSITRQTGHKLDYWIIAALAVAVVLLASGYFVRRNPATNAMAMAPVGASAKPFNPPSDTLVVLPFANLSGDKTQQYFSDGITEELTNALGQNTALRVIAWDTASHYRDTTQPATAIGKALDVANVLTGKILRQGSTVRVIVELVNARTGYQVWADHYDDSLTNVFQVQDKISAAIAGALKVKFASVGAAPTVNPHAYDLVLKARALEDKAFSAGPFEQARALFEQAIALDPHYADARAGLAGVWLGLISFTNQPIKEALPKLRAEANQALSLDPRNVQALGILAAADELEGRVDKARVEIEHALAINPSDAGAHVNYGLVLPLRQGLAQYLEAVQLDPDSTIAQNNAADTELDLGEYAQALVPWRSVLRLDPTSAASAFGLAETYALLHRNAEAVQAFSLVKPTTELAKALVAAGRLTYQSLFQPKLHTTALAAVGALRRRADLDPVSMTEVLQLELALGESKPALEHLPKYCSAQPVFCNDLSVNPVYLPLHGDPRFQALVKQYDTVSKPAPAASAAPSQKPSPSVPLPAEGGS